MKLIFSFTGLQSTSISKTFLTPNNFVSISTYHHPNVDHQTSLLLNNRSTTVFTNQPSLLNSCQIVRWTTTEGKVSAKAEKPEKTEKKEKKKTEKSKKEAAPTTSTRKPSEPQVLWPPRTFETEAKKFPLLMKKESKSRSEMSSLEIQELIEREKLKSQERVREMVARRAETERAIEEERLEIEAAKWKLRSGTIVQRFPVIAPPLPQWEQEFLEWKNQRDDRVQTLIYERKKKILPNPPAKKPFKPISFYPEEQWWTEADETEDLKSLDRYLTRSLYLLVHKPSDIYLPWQFPSALHLVGETMRKTAQRAVKTNLSPTVRIFYVSNAPSVHVSVPFSPQDKEKNQIDGYKLFLFRAQLLKGDGIKEKKPEERRYMTADEKERKRQEEERIRIQEAQPVDDADHLIPKDYVWVTKKEMAKYLPEKLYERIQHVLIPDYDEYIYNF